MKSEVQAREEFCEPTIYCLTSEMKAMNKR